jgi:hypothetical protein
LIGLE